MKNFNMGEAAAFGVVLWLIGVAIHHVLNGNTPIEAIVGVGHIASPSLPAPQAPQTPQAPPVVTITKIWPDGATPTKVVHIPDTQEPAKGLLNVNLSQGDDLELDVDPYWYFSADGQNNLSGSEIVVNDGKGFESLEDYYNYMKRNEADESEVNKWWMKSRVIRMRLAAGYSHASFSLTILKKEAQNSVMQVSPQAFGDLTIAPISMRGWSNGKILINVAFRNSSSMNTLAIAMHDQDCIIMPCALDSTLTGSDGAMYGIDTSGLAGINGLRTRPEYLTSIGPGQERKASLTFYRRNGSSESATSFELQMEIVVNANYRYGEYNYYRPHGDFLPPYCRLINAVFEIQIPHNDN